MNVCEGPAGPEGTGYRPALITNYFISISRVVGHVDCECYISSCLEKREKRGELCIFIIIALRESAKKLIFKGS